MVDVICPNVKGDMKGAICTLCRRHIKELERAAIGICLSENFVYCPYYQEHDELGRAGKGPVWEDNPGGQGACHAE